MNEELDVLVVSAFGERSKKLSNVRKGRLNYRAAAALDTPRLLRRPWKKGRGAILLFCPEHYSKPKYFILSFLNTVQ
jgi:hypothetical protein